MILELLARLIFCLFVPVIAIGVLAKSKALVQGRRGPRLMQPLFNLVKLLNKVEMVSDTTSWLFRFSAALNLAIALWLLSTVPWLAGSSLGGSCDLILFVYLLAVMRFFTLMAPLDSASPFGTFAVSRESTLSILIEPAAALSLVALSMLAGSSDLVTVFAKVTGHPEVWLLSGMSILMAGLVEASRMPVDDPSTHLELTMVHEAMMLECSATNLALFELSSAIRLSIFLGLSASCFLQGLALSIPANLQLFVGGAVVCVLAAALGLFEAVSIKLNWRKTPEFTSYALTLSLVSCIAALGGALWLSP